MQVFFLSLRFFASPMRPTAVALMVADYRCGIRSGLGGKGMQPRLQRIFDCCCTCRCGCRASSGTCADHVPLGVAPLILWRALGILRWQISIMSIGGIIFKMTIATGGRKFYAEFIAKVLTQHVLTQYCLNPTLFKPAMVVCNEELYGSDAATGTEIGIGDKHQRVFAWMSLQ